MKSLSFILPERNKILRMHVKDKSCNNHEALQLYQKEILARAFSCKYPKSFRNNFFYRTTAVAALDLYFSIRKNFLKKKVSGEIAFDLISLFHVQIQEPTRSSTITSAICLSCKILLSQNI